MTTLDITDTAKADISAILDWTLTNFGSAAMERYAAGINAALARLIDRDLPVHGTARDDIASGLRSLDLAAIVPRARHLILFRTDQERVIVLRVVHHAADPAAVEVG